MRSSDIQSVLLAATLLLGGCESASANYPSHLPRLVATGKTVDSLPPIAGRYADRGTAFSKEGKELGSISLTELLHRTDARPALAGQVPSLAGADTVVVVGPENETLELQSWQGSTQTAMTRRFQFSIYGTHCAYLPPALTFAAVLADGGYLYLPCDVRSYNSPISFGGGQTDLVLRKATDGSLIVRFNESDAGILLVIPLWSTGKAWYRFPPAAGPERISPENVPARAQLDTAPVRSAAGETVKINTPAFKLKGDVRTFGADSLGNLILTDSSLCFRRFNQFSNAAPEISVRYDALADCSVKQAVLGVRKLIVRTKEGEIHHFGVEQGPDEKGKALAARLESICEFIRARIPKSSAI